jgi:hypothetical protein
MRRKRKLLVITMSVASAVTIAGAALAHWTSIGSGAGTAVSTSAVNSVIAAGTNAADLYPGAVMSVTVTINNPNPYAVVVNSISAGSSGALTSPTCSAGAVISDARPTDPTGLSQSEGAKTVAAGGSATYTLITRMLATADNGCQARTFALALTATLTAA